MRGSAGGSRVGAATTTGRGPTQTTACARLLLIAPPVVIQKTTAVSMWTCVANDEGGTRTLHSKMFLTSLVFNAGSVTRPLRGPCIDTFAAEIRPSDRGAPGCAVHAPRWRANCRAGDQSIVPAPQLDLGGKEPNKSWNASSLAFLGDSVYELYARRRCFHPPKSAAKYREAVVQMVRAEAQSAACAKLSASGILTEVEAEVLRWGKNAPGTLPKRLERAVYRDATGASSCRMIHMIRMIYDPGPMICIMKPISISLTHVYPNAGLEALIGYLYMSGYHERLNTIMDSLDLL